MTELVFYTNPMSRGAIARWMLEEVGEPYQTVLLDFETTMKAPEYLAINPMGKVPAIVHGGRVVTECAAICAYLADVFPDSGLGPTDEERADYYRWMFFAAGPLEHAITNNACGFHVSQDQRKMAGYGSFDQVVDVLDTLLSARDHVCGKRFTAADVYLGSHIAWGTQFGTLPKKESFAAYSDRILSREAAKRAKKIDEGLVEQVQQPPPRPA